MSKQRRVLLLHGWGGKKETHWLTWLEKELLNQSHEVFFPKIPNNYNPKLDRWLTYIDNYVKEFQPDIVIAHSLGALAWWHYCFSHQLTHLSTVSVAPPTFASFPSKMQSFFPLPLLRIKEELHTIIYAKDDKNIEIDVLEKWASQVACHTIQKEEGEHLDHFSHTYTLPELLPFF